MAHFIHQSWAKIGGHPGNSPLHTDNEVFSPPQSLSLWFLGIIDTAPLAQVDMIELVIQ